MRIVATVQARMGSTRLPGKVLADIAGEPMLVRVVERARRSKTLDEVAVATTSDGEDDPIAALCTTRGYPFGRGAVRDVLDRTYRLTRSLGASVVVRLTADCPLIDPDIIDHTVGEFLKADPPVDFAANRFPPPLERTYPIGLDVEVCTFAALERAWREALDPHEREHVMPYLYEEPGRFRVLHVRCEEDYGRFRWTVDTAEDLKLVRAIYAAFDGRDDFGWREVLDLLERRPDLIEINAAVVHKGFRDAET
jgi:spore coat polysaccharide biosynthesis protein SpsF